jgi:hypothetical protein
MVPILLSNQIIDFFENTPPPCALLIDPTPSSEFRRAAAAWRGRVACAQVIASAPPPEVAGSPFFVGEVPALLVRGGGCSEVEVHRPPPGYFGFLNVVSRAVQGAMRESQRRLGEGGGGEGLFSGGGILRGGVGSRGVFVARGGCDEAAMGGDGMEGGEVSVIDLDVSCQNEFDPRQSDAPSALLKEEEIRVKVATVAAIALREKAAARSRNYRSQK